MKLLTGLAVSIAVVMFALLVILGRATPVYILAALSASLAVVVVTQRSTRLWRNDSDVAARQAALRDAGVAPAVAEALARGQKIDAIRAYREERSVTLREAKAAVDQMERVIFSHPTP